ncbi:MAG: bifunctional phosphoribosylaminoimidazolecarboxamide formyltransferase/IMP cyclohydrolase, partial [Bryobacteraceae bacterium]
MPTIQRALISVTDKSGLVDFARGLRGLGVELVSTGGTAAMLREAGLSARDVSEVTGFPEMLDGRVKTIHPRIAGGVLAVRGKADHMAALTQHEIDPIDMVIVNLYAFDKVAAKKDATVPELIENIDIGGPTIIRAAAKNYQDVAVVVSPDDYPAILEELNGSDGKLAVKTCWRLAKKAWDLTAAYDRAISARLNSIEIEDNAFREQPAPLPHILQIRAERTLDLRYGENPHQSAALYSAKRGGIAAAEQLHGKELSYNNLVDLDAAWHLVQEFDRPAAAIIKHTNPCGCAEQETLAGAYRKAFEADPVSAFGGVLAFNRELDEETAHEIAQTFIEAIAALGYGEKALSILAAKKNLRLLKTSDTPEEVVIKTISGGYLAQTADVRKLDRSTALVKT